MEGWAPRRTVISSSRSKRRRASRSSGATSSTFRATARSRRSWRARYTTPDAPRPISVRSLNSGISSSSAVVRRRARRIIAALRGRRRLRSPTALVARGRGCDGTCTVVHGRPETRAARPAGDVAPGPMGPLVESTADSTSMAGRRTRIDRPATNAPTRRSVVSPRRAPRTVAARAEPATHGPLAEPLRTIVSSDRRTGSQAAPASRRSSRPSTTTSARAVSMPASVAAASSGSST